MQLQGRPQHRRDLSSTVDSGRSEVWQMITIHFSNVIESGRFLLLRAIDPLEQFASFCVHSNDECHISGIEGCFKSFDILRSRRGSVQGAPTIP
jgi:hypothetical protein